MNRQNQIEELSTVLYFADDSCGKGKSKGGVSMKEQQKYFSPQDAQNMSPQEVQANYEAIRESMKEW